MIDSSIVDVTVAKHFSKQGFVDVNNIRLTITNTPRQSRDSEVSSRTTDDVSVTSGTVQVSGIPATTSENYLRMYFESEKRSGGGELDCLQYDQKEGTATVSFHDRAGTVSTSVSSPEITSHSLVCWATI